MKKIKKYNCDDKIKEYYIKYLPSYSFKSFVEYFQNNEFENYHDYVLNFVNYQRKQYEPNTPQWISNLILTRMVYIQVNLDTKQYKCAFITIMQLSIESMVVKKITDDISFFEVPFPENCDYCLEELFKKILISNMI